MGNTLKLRDIPSSNASRNDIASFAMTFNGYKYHGSFDKCANVASEVSEHFRKHNSYSDVSLDTLRTALFFHHRAIRHAELTPNMQYVRKLLAAIRKRVAEMPNKHELPELLEKELDKLARKYCAFEKVDKSTFQRCARILQSLWREEQDYKIGEHKYRSVGRKLGSRLPMPWARETLANYLTDTIKSVVRYEVLDKSRSKGKLYGKPRIFNDLLSSQPLCFNLFGELHQDLNLASKVFEELSQGIVEKVLRIEFEYSPGRSGPKYTGDKSAFDVYVEYISSQKKVGFIGVEVKYHENLTGKESRYQPLHNRIAKKADCFREEGFEELNNLPLQQIWRDHLLALSMLQAKDFEEGFFVFLYPELNNLCSDAVSEYKKHLKGNSHFQDWTLEQIACAIQKKTNAKWIEHLYDRYLNFQKIKQ